MGIFGNLKPMVISKRACLSKSSYKINKASSKVTTLLFKWKVSLTQKKSCQNVVIVLRILRNFYNFSVWPLKITEVKVVLYAKSWNLAVQKIFLIPFFKK